VANIVNLDRVGKGYGGVGPLLSEVSAGIEDDDRIGVVGLNGSGKSTLLRLVARQEEPDQGRVTHRRDLRVLALPQALDLPPGATVRDVVLGDIWLPAAFGA
jgi:ATPase subunit of ABC transporter with duplicated ATPase domains